MSVECVKWLGRCDRCGEAAPEERDSFEAAQQDADECPCLDEESK
jgi:hypothetical protein